LKAGVTVEASEFPFELGYVFVLPSARRQGFSIRLTRAALTTAGGKGVFATSRTNNDGMHATLEKFGFVQTGSSYASIDGDHHIHLFVRRASQPGALE
jgi:GNAT superfamily N-acetyltransferase